MKGVLFYLTVFVFCSLGYGQRPDSFYYQTVVRDRTGQLVVSKTLTLKLSILAGSPTGLVVYSEKQTDTTNKEGLISLVVGEGSDKTRTFTTIDWNADKYFLKVEVDTAGGSDFAMLGTTQVLNVPFETLKKSEKRSTEVVLEDEFLVTRKYVGQYVDFRHTGPENSAGPNIIWIKTTLDKNFGKLSAYGRTCDFKAGDKLYLRRIYYSPGDVTGYWIYQIENDSSVFYRLSEFQYDKKVYVETMFLD